MIRNQTVCVCTHVIEKRKLNKFIFWFVFLIEGKLTVQMTVHFTIEYTAKYFRADMLWILKGYAEKML